MSVQATSRAGPPLALISLVLSAVETYAFTKLAPDHVFGSRRLVALCCFVLNFALYWLYKIFIQRLFLTPLRHLPSPKRSNYILGEFLSEFENPPGDTFRRWVNTIPNDGIIRYRTLFNRSQLIVTSHEALKSVLSDNTYDWEKPQELVRVLGKVIGELGLILVEGDIHKFQRKHLLPSFRLNHIKGLYPVFWKKGSELNATLLKEGPAVLPAKSDDKSFEVEIGAFATRATLDIIGIAGFGHDFGALRDPNAELVQKYNWLVDPAPEKALWFITNIIVPEWIISRVPWRLTRRINEIQAELISFSTNMVRDRRAAFKNDAKYAESMDDILSLLIKSNDFSDEDLANQTLTMMAAGHETTSSALTWITYLLAKHPEYQTKLRAEIRAALPDPADASSTITAADIDRLPLLAAICQETLRLYPTVPVTGRLSVRDTRINDVHVPMGTFVILSPWAINRSTKLWGSNAEEFYPERWINADGTANKTGGATSNYSQITFLHGPRSCIGQDFAGSELKVLCATLVGRYSFELARSEADGQYTPAGVVTTKAKKGMWVKVKEVSGW